MQDLAMWNDNVLIRLEEDPETTASGNLIKPEGAQEHVFRIGRVIKAGPGKWNSKGTARIPMVCKPGMRVLFVKFVATHTESAKQLRRSHLDKDHAIIKDQDVLLEVDEDFKIEQVSQ
jgi:co-chaperonin GroES (HSP10)